MRSSSVFQYVIVMACSALVSRVDGVPRYAPTTPQVGEIETKSPILRNPSTCKMTPTNDGVAPKPNANVLERIKQDAQTCKTGYDLDPLSAPQSSKDIKAAVGNGDHNMTTGAGSVLVAAALSLSDSKLAEVAKDAYCFQNNSQRAQKNIGTPDNIYDARNSGLYRELGEELSVLHNFREDLKLDTPADRLIAGLQAVAEYKAWKDHKMDRSEWKYLDPDLPNAKFIEKDGGHKEAVYNRHTGKRIDHGNNQGTYNDYDQDSSLIEKALHGVKDVGDWGLCGTPADNEKVSTKWRAVLESIMEGHKSEEIDTSKLETLLKERINMLERFIAQVKQGERLAERDTSLYEGNVKETLLELQRIDEQIKSFDVSDDERKQIVKQAMANVKSLGDKVRELEAILAKMVNKSDDVTCQCANPQPYAFNGNSSIPGWANCENCGRLVGTTLNGKIISKNPLTNGKAPRWVSWEEARKISERVNGKK